MYGVIGMSASSLHRGYRLSDRHKAQRILQLKVLLLLAIHISFLVFYKQVIFTRLVPCGTEPISYPTTCRNLSMAELQLVAKLRTSLPVWMYFGFETTDDSKLRNEELAVCRLCAKRVSTKGQNIYFLIFAVTIPWNITSKKK